jgi:hypothetical protein
MNWRIVLALLALLAPFHVSADIGYAPGQATSQLCRQAIAAAERTHGIPAHLLAAIARVESGRRDQTSGAFNPWPWTTNVDGVGAFYETKAQAVAASVSIRPKVVRSIDVGCMQISLTYHPNAFSSMDQAFDPASNAEYGARFLSQLFEKTASWPRAVELYHSATPDLGRDYQLKVYAGLPEEQRIADVAQPPALANAWAATIHHPLPSIATGSHPMPSMSSRQSPPHIIALASSSPNGSTPGRSLDSYRSMPVRIAFRGP